MADSKIPMTGQAIPILYTQRVTVPANGRSTIDFSSAVPSGKTVVALGSVQLGVYPLPYMAQIGAGMATYVESFSADTNSMIITNTSTSAWNNYVLKLLIYVI